jgi:hypothetical protein
MLLGVSRLVFRKRERIKDWDVIVENMVCLRKKRIFGKVLVFAFRFTRWFSWSSGSFFRF